MAQPKVIIITGLPYAGKTTLSKKLVRRFGLKHVSVDDEINASGNDVATMAQQDWNAVYTKAYKKLAELLAANKSVIFDGASLKRSERQNLRNIAAEHRVKAILLYVKASPEVIHRRWAKNQETKERGHLEEELLQRALDMFEEPQADEQPIIISESAKLDRLFGQLGLGKVDATEVLANVSPKVGSTKFIAIDGHGGSGKSSLANYLSEKLHAEIVHTDDFPTFDNPINWWPLVVERIFGPIANGVSSLRYPRSNAWWDNDQPLTTIEQPVTTIMILEGVSSLRKEFRPYISYGIFVQAPEEVCMERGVYRDLSTGKTKEEVTKVWRQWLQDENGYFKRDDPKSYADLIIDGTKPFEEQIV